MVFLPHEYVRFHEIKVDDSIDTVHEKRVDEPTSILECVYCYEDITKQNPGKDVCICGPVHDTCVKKWVESYASDPLICPTCRQSWKVPPCIVSKTKGIVRSTFHKQLLRIVWITYIVSSILFLPLWIWVVIKMTESNWNMTYIWTLLCIVSSYSAIAMCLIALVYPR
jgi:hypothetical protein